MLVDFGTLTSRRAQFLINTRVHSHTSLRRTAITTSLQVLLPCDFSLTLDRRHVLCFTWCTAEDTYTSTCKVDLALRWVAHYNGNISKEPVIKVTDWTNALIKKQKLRRCYCSFFVFFVYRFRFSSRAVSRVQGSQAFGPYLRLKRWCLFWARFPLLTPHLIPVCRRCR